jgi:hypothetical protein
MLLQVSCDTYWGNSGKGATLFTIVSFLVDARQKLLHNRSFPAFRPCKCLHAEDPDVLIVTTLCRCGFCANSLLRCA